jgi:hypothetical protein
MKNKMFFHFANKSTEKPSPNKGIYQVYFTAQPAEENKHLCDSGQIMSQNIS